MSQVPGDIDKKAQLSEGSIVCRERTIIRGNVKIGSRTIIHPKVTINAEKGSIIIGDCNIIEENVVIINKNNESMTIGNRNLFEVGTYCECLSIGDNNIFEYRCKLGPELIITNDCIIGALCNLSRHETLEEKTVVFGPNCERRRMKEKQTSQDIELNYLMKLIPYYHRCEKKY